jgi:hypothetical protein
VQAGGSAIHERMQRTMQRMDATWSIWSVSTVRRRNVAPEGGRHVDHFRNVHLKDRGFSMQQDRPDIQPNEILIIRNVEEDFHVILEIRCTLYRAHYMPDKNNTGDQPLRPGDTLQVIGVNTVGSDPMTTAERVTQQSQGDGSRFAFYEYQAVPPQG